MKELIKTGIKGLDMVLSGGIPKGNGVVITGAPGTGKTTIGVQFLHQGTMIGEPGLYITFEELPEQIYSDMLNYGIDIEKLEGENLLKVVTLSPEILLREMLQPSGLFEELVQSINCQRVVIDSLSLIKYLEQGDQEMRKSIYSLKNSLVRNRLTSLLIVEQSTRQSEIPFENFLFDGVIQLDFVEKFDDYKERTLEVVKMRGTKVFEGTHTYRFIDEGIYLVPPHIPVNRVTSSYDSSVTTGDKLLDKSLDGGIQKGLIYLLEVDSIAGYKRILMSIVSELLKKDRKFAYLLSNTITIDELLKLFKSYNIDLEEYILNKKGVFTEQYNRVINPKIASHVYNIANLDNESFKAFIFEELVAFVKNDLDSRDGEWFWVYNINSILEKRGIDFVKDIYVELVAAEKEIGITSFVICNADKTDKETLALLQQKSDVIIKTWVYNRYQYLQVTKSQSGVVSAPYIVETINEIPFFRLL
ncbi:ATPase domain-containing protein [Aquibacillus halophilus]|nr:ATPase domain-containing protein [Aquibacillus halophilus]